MRTAEELKANYEQGYKSTPISKIKHEMLAAQQEQLVTCIREFFDEGDACGPVCYLNELMKNRADNADGLRISSFIMRLERFDRCINVLRK
ncbi:hypothetical protein [Dyadobacter fanqingshengii]|uniref:Uncharacterized protein n=1 Tax=Dyadobacter fanqingshengii TaxID=2906443 RepID=A0A9X1P841_9BACT|nr:hypothetical protein [Dyadobacter fanqingshengii]MCF0040121.1 hypothetical protein [Dyadobacter fanqingshengii]USJ38127.1 hypothetical protein NFI81_10130 [Dyadobacter fanqingshengii]